MTGETVKHKWKNLRDSYIKYIKYLKGSTGSAKKYQNWSWAAHLEFLKDTIVPRATTSNMSQIHEITHIDEVYEQDETADSVIVTSTSQMLPPTKTPKRKEVTEDVAAVLTYLENKKKSKTDTKLDHIDNLFLSYAHTFKTFPPRTQAILKMEMSQLSTLSTLTLQFEPLQFSLQICHGQIVTQVWLIISLAIPFNLSTIQTYI